VSLPDTLLAEVAGKYGTPAFVYDLDAVEARVRALKEALGPRFTVAYAAKANPSLGVLSFLSSRVDAVDVASRGELAAVRKAGFPPRRILATGPAKSDADLAALVGADVGRIHAEGPEELDRLEAAGARLGKRVNAGLRLNPGWGIAEARTIIGGPGAKKFGFDLPSARRALRERARWPHVEIAGFQIFNASNVLDASLLAENAGRVVDLALSLARRHDLSLESIDFGGGLGVPYAAGESPLDLALLGRGLAPLVEKAGSDPRLAGTRLVFEPGRFLLAEAGAYLVRVVGTKRSGGLDYALVDGGVHHLLRPALLGTPHAVRKVGAGAGRRRYVVAGPLCTSLDVLHGEASLPRLAAGDLLAVANAGAYGYTESMPLFLSHEWPAEVAVRGGRAAPLRRPPSVTSLLAAQLRPF